jgi:hypothetical protein
LVVVVVVDELVVVVDSAPLGEVAVVLEELVTVVLRLVPVSVLY